MTPKYFNTYAVPTYAITYLEYGEDSGLTSEDIKNVDQWVKAISGDEFPALFEWDCTPYFTSAPAFGLPAMCVDCKVYLYD